MMVQGVYCLVKYIMDVMYSYMNDIHVTAVWKDT
jgi:hypothetical protein